MLPPGPRQPGVVQLLRWNSRPVPFMRECAERFGDVFTLRLPGMGSGTFVLVSAPDLIKEVFTGDVDTLRAGEANRVLEPLVGSYSVLLLDNAPHLRQRRLLIPPFHGERMQAYGAIMRDITAAALASWPVGGRFSLHAQMQQITLDVILRCVFGVAEGARMRELHALLVEFFTPPPLLFMALPLLQRDLPFLPYRKFLRVRARVDAELYRLIRERRAAGDVASREDVLSLLLGARDEQQRPMSDVELRDELVTMLAAGHETTATSLSWAFSRILAEPDVRARLDAELADVCAGGRLEPAMLPRLEYLDAVCKETLRLQPILPLVVRRLHRPWKLGPWELPAGVGVAPCIYLAHRRAESWPEPDRFAPERFLGAKIDPYAWLPFGGGARRCIGMAFALYEMKIVLAQVLLGARLALDGPPVRVVRRSITLAPSGGTQVRLKERRTPAARVRA